MGTVGPPCHQGWRISRRTGSERIDKLLLAGLHSLGQGVRMVVHGEMSEIEQRQAGAAVDLQEPAEAAAVLASQAGGRDLRHQVEDCLLYTSPSPRD